MTEQENGNLALLHSSNWASNIGNSFFTLGVEYALKQALDKTKVIQTDQLSAMAWEPSETQHKRDIKYPQYSECDWFILCGPLLNKKFINWYNEVLENISLSNTKLVLLNVGGVEYTDAEIDLCRSFLKQHSPYIIMTRDRHAYEYYHDLANHSYDGIDFAFFAPDYFSGYDTPRLNPYVTCTFDGRREPHIEIEGLDNGDRELSVSLDQGLLNRIPYRISRYLPENCPDKISGYRVVRPRHNVLRTPKRVLYNKTNTYFSQTPFGYLNIYRNAALTISDRLHGVIPSLAYGNPARLVSDSSRAHLFSRIGLDEISNQVMKANLDRIDEEKEGMIQFLGEFD